MKKKPGLPSPKKTRRGDESNGLETDQLEIDQPKESREPAVPESKVLAVVGIGASAGGLESFSRLLENLPSSTGMAYVLIQHLDPSHGSQMSEILSRKSKMLIAEVSGDTAVEADHVYVTPSDRNLHIENGVLKPVPRSSGFGNPNMGIDDFLHSLAKDRGNRAFGIVLSGTGSDGTLGLRDIKSEGGITFAQEPSTAKFDAMPSSAIASGTVDFVMPPEAIARQLALLASHPYVAQNLPLSAVVTTPPEAANLAPIFTLLRTTTGIDFTHYKNPTILRRIERRMAIHSIETLGEYAGKLRTDRAEAEILSQDFLINVTAFFREPEVFTTLRTVIFPALLKNRSNNEAIRIWVPGCSSGEEAYSLAMELTDFLQSQNASVGIQIFATDLSDAVIEKARAGIYVENAVARISPERLQRYFVKREQVYQITQGIRNLCVFAKQDLTRDPPFSRIDLISCCNLLIYLGPILQKKALSLFHYALKPEGYLVLGSSESISSASDSFHMVDRKQRIFAKQGSVTWDPARPAGTRFHVTDLPPTQGAPPQKNIQKYVDRLLLAEYAPPGVIVDDAMHLLQVRGETSHYIHLPAGDPTTDLTRLLRPGLLPAVRSAVAKARMQEIEVKESGLRVKYEREIRNVTLRVCPLRDPDTKESHYLILFEETKAARKGGPELAAKAKKPLARQPAQEEILRLEEELRSARDYLQSIIESQEAATEELRSANEEAQANNEELDTAKEELQASNEELNTVNDELRARSVEQATINSELRKLLASINIPLVMVGRNLHIRWFTPSIQPLLNLLPSDQGRPITDFHSPLIPNFRTLLLEALAGEQGLDVEIESAASRWLSLRILPYRGADNTIDGVIATLVDIDDLKRARDFAEALGAVVREPLIVLDATLCVRAANNAFYEMFHMGKEEVDGRLLFDLKGGQWNIPKLRDLLERILPEQGWIKEFEVEESFEGLGVRTMLLHGRELRQGNGERIIVLAFDDISALRQSADELRKTNDYLKQFIYAASHDLQEPIRTILTFTDRLLTTYGDTLGEQGRGFVNYAMEGAQRLEALISGLREFWELNERDEQQTLVDCNEVLKTVLLNLGSAAVESAAIIQVDPLPEVIASAVPLIQLFQNLIGNAIKYRSDLPSIISTS